VLLAFPDEEVGVYYCASASDALGYAQDFLTVFKAIGWKVNVGAPSESLNDKITGLALVASGRHCLPPVAEALRDALRIYEIEVATFCDPNCNARSSGFILSVGLSRRQISNDKTITRPWLQVVDVTQMRRITGHLAPGSDLRLLLLSSKFCPPRFCCL
jgi:hypothetical protein